MKMQHLKVNSHRNFPGGPIAKILCSQCKGAQVSLGAQMVKRLPTMRETWVLSLGLEGLLEKVMATHSSTLAWRIPSTEDPDGLQVTESERVRHN